MLFKVNILSSVFGKVNNPVQQNITDFTIVLLQLYICSIKY